MMDTSHEQGDGLSPAAKSAVAALRAEEDMPAEARARVWDRLAAGAEAKDMSQGTGRGAGAWALIGLAVAAAGVLAVAGIQSAAVPVARTETAPAAQYGGESVGALAAERRGGAGAKAEEGAAAPEVAAAEVPVAEEPTDRSARTGRRRAPQVAEGPALGREAALLQLAQVALAGARPAEALGHLATYDREFGGGGVLRPEHDGLRAVALCEAGRADEGRAAAAAFLRAHAGSVQAERVRGACGAERDESSKN